MSAQGEDDINVIKDENSRLKKELRLLAIEKNKMEDKLYRAINKVLNTKKRRIRELEEEIKLLKSGTPIQNELARIRSSQEEKENISKKKFKVTQVTPAKKSGVPIPMTDSSDDDDAQAPGSGYGSETDVDDEVSSTSNIPRKKTVVVAYHEPSSSKSPNNPVENAKNDNDALPLELARAQESSNSINVSSSQSQSTDMEDLVDELCS